MNRFCSACGSSQVVSRTPEGDNRPRMVCDACGFIHYDNPKLVVGCIVQRKNQVLLCKRAIEPRHGFWTIPGGFLEIGEGTQEGALRETREEAEAEVHATRPFCHIDIPHIGQAYVLFCAKFRNDNPTFGAGEETLESALVPISDIPWKDLAFPVVGVALKLYAEDYATDCPRYHHGTLEAPSSDNPSFGRPALVHHQALELAP